MFLKKLKLFSEQCEWIKIHLHCSLKKVNNEGEKQLRAALSKPML
jgi:hypothetical protein